jgi:hypothetical protein
MQEVTRGAHAVLARCGSLADAIVAGLRLSPPWAVVDVVVQDEFTHDIVMAPDGDGARSWIVLDTT